LLGSREQENETLGEGETKKRNIRWFLAGNEGDSYIQESVVPLQ
jgi:hypothetical protein